MARSTLSRSDPEIDGPRTLNSQAVRNPHRLFRLTGINKSAGFLCSKRMQQFIADSREKRDFWARLILLLEHLLLGFEMNWVILAGCGLMKTIEFASKFYRPFLALLLLKIIPE
ncbi:hypothetical protein NPIL_190761 [Nephila pilipes]|uniref:Uncharacterized protein n=1 Tax=Nephila pilipes TaxID=299642 RepID=A0A8X6UNY8_NEPPI|nr:hypothetical protein NPIL_190761 [Nephila pilipes]